MLRKEMRYGLRHPADDHHLVRLLIRELLRVARREDELADQEAATVPYWRPCPASVADCAAARALEHQAEVLYST